MKNKLNQMIDQSTWPTPHSAASTSPPLFRDAHGRPAPDGEDAPGAEVSRHLRRVMSPAGPRPSTPQPGGLVDAEDIARSRSGWASCEAFHPGPRPRHIPPTG